MILFKSSNINASTTTTRSSSRNGISSRSSSAGDNAMVTKQQKEVRQAMLDLAVKMYKEVVDGLDGDNKNVPPSTFRTIREAFRNPPWLNRNSNYHRYKVTNIPTDVNVDPSEEHLSAKTEESGVKKRVADRPVVVAARSMSRNSRKLEYLQQPPLRREKEETNWQMACWNK